ncbi:diguanylate cyclase [Sulfurimonas aquatica]|uniref:diguanylate cyclase n=1 Tax=Sulfurimonas aquatica TaxID=2672570 RepID=A0A975AYL6_9BACT|nr:diguanylate cyclase [Sulfurimonas aquatica]QSZ40992.1 diguanylate cyclase [Sulfurimonas aquatica]
MSQRILIVEDNKTLAKLISKKIENALNFEVDIAYTLLEAKLFLKRYEYFIALLDINLPDAPNGEVVDYVLSKGTRAIVLSANIDKEFRKKILQKNIVDYVNKGGVNEINYIIQTIIRLQKNQNHKVLIVDDSLVFRKTMQTMLKNLFFQVITVAHGEEALGIMNVHQDISLVLTDYNMPVMDGLELTYEIRKTSSKNEISILAISSNQDEEINAMFLKQGANDYIKKPFSKEEFSCRVHNAIEALENIQIVTNHANRDYLTGLYNRRYFFQNMNDYQIDVQNSGEQFAIAMIDIDHFKKINDTYGHDVADKIIVFISEILRTSTSHRDIVARFGGEEFCVVLKNINRYSALDILERIKDEVANYSFPLDADNFIKSTISIGAVMNSEESLEDSISQADLMLYNAKNKGRNQVVFEN